MAHAPTSNGLMICHPSNRSLNLARFREMVMVAQGNGSRTLPSIIAYTTIKRHFVAYMLWDEGCKKLAINILGTAATFHRHQLLTCWDNIVDISIDPAIRRSKHWLGWFGDRNRQMPTSYLEVMLLMLMYAAIVRTS